LRYGEGLRLETKRECLVCRLSRDISDFKVKAETGESTVKTCRICRNLNNKKYKKQKYAQPKYSETVDFMKIIDEYNVEIVKAERDRIDIKEELALKYSISTSLIFVILRDNSNLIVKTKRKKYNLDKKIVTTHEYDSNYDRIVEEANTTEDRQRAIYDSLQDFIIVNGTKYELLEKQPNRVVFRNARGWREEIFVSEFIKLEVTG
jgi:hypothetical protein